MKSLQSNKGVLGPVLDREFAHRVLTKIQGTDCPMYIAGDLLEWECELRPTGLFLGAAAYDWLSDWMKFKYRIDIRTRQSEWVQRN